MYMWMCVNTVGGLTIFNAFARGRQNQTVSCQPSPEFMYHTVLEWGVEVITMNINALHNYFLYYILFLCFRGSYYSIFLNIIFNIIHIIKSEKIP